MSNMSNFDNIMHRIAQGVLNIEEGLTTVDRNSQIHKAMSELCDLVAAGNVSCHGIEYNDTCGCKLCEERCNLCD